MLLRRAAVIGASAVALICVLMIVLEFANYSVVATPRWNTVIGFTAPLLAPVFWYAIQRSRQEQPVPFNGFGMRSGLPFPLRGGRQLVFVGILGLVALGVVAAFVSNSTGDPVERNGEFYSRDHGRETKSHSRRNRATQYIKRTIDFLGICA